MVNNSERIEALSEQLALIVTRLDDFHHRFTALEKANRLQLAHTSNADNTSSTSGQLRPRLKLDVPRFDGIEAPGWIFKIS